MKQKPTLDIQGLSVSKDRLESPNSSFISAPISPGGSKLADLFESNKLISSKVLSPKGALFFEKGKSVAEQSTAHKTGNLSVMPETTNVNPVGFLRQKYISEVELGAKRVVNSPKGFQQKINSRQEHTAHSNSKLSIVGETSDEVKYSMMRFPTGPMTNEAGDRMAKIREDLRSGGYSKPPSREQSKGKPQIETNFATQQFNMTKETSWRGGMSSLTAASSIRKPGQEIRSRNPQPNNGAHRRTVSMQHTNADRIEQAGKVSAAASVVSFTCEFIQKIISENKDLILRLEAQDLRQRQLEAVVQELQTELESHRSDRSIVSNLKDKVRALRSSNTSLCSNLKQAQDRVFELEQQLLGLKSTSRYNCDNLRPSETEMGNNTPRFDRERGSSEINIRTSTVQAPPSSHNAYSRCLRLENLPRQREHRSVPVDRMVFADTQRQDSAQIRMELSKPAIPRRALFA